MTLDEVKARIRALQARTPANGCTEAEAMAAAAAVLRLMREHALDPDQVACSQHAIQLGRKQRAIIDVVWGRVAHVCRCVCWTQVSYQGRWETYFGRDPWPELAAWLHGVVQGAYDRASREFYRSPAYKARRTKRTRGQARRAFAEGFAVSILEKLLEMVLPSEAEQREADQAIAQRAVDKLGMTFSQAKTPKAVADRRFDRDRMHGAVAGDRAQLRWGVSDSGAPLAIEGPKG